MGSPILIPVVVDPSGAVKGAGDVDDALQKTGKAVDAVTTAGQVNTEQLTEQFRQQTQVVKEETGKQKDEVLLSQREINSAQREGLKATGSALAQTVEQSATAFDGTVSGALSAVSNIATGVAALSGNALVAAVAGIGALVFSAISGVVQKSQADIAAEKQAVSDLTTELEKLGANGTSSVSSVDAKLKEFSTTTDGSDKDLEHLKDTADQAGVSFATYSRALAGNATDQEKLYSSVKKQIDAVQQQIQTASIGTQGRNRDVAAMQKQLSALEDVKSALEDQNKTLGESKDRVNDLSQATERNAKALSDAAAAAKVVAAGAQADADIGDQLADQQSKQTATLIADQKKLATAVEDSNGRQTKAVKDARAAEVAASKAADAETVKSFISAQETVLKALLSENDSEEKIYEEFGKDVGKAVIKAAGQNPTLLQAIAGASAAQRDQIGELFAATGTAAGFKAAKAASAAITGAKLPPVSLQTAVVPPDINKLVANAQKQLNGKTLKLPLGVYSRNGVKIL